MINISFVDSEVEKLGHGWNIDLTKETTTWLAFIRSHF
jgi:hypothetical protein